MCLWTKQEALLVVQREGELITALYYSAMMSCDYLDFLCGRRQVQLADSINFLAPGAAS